MHSDHCLLAAWILLMQNYTIVASFHHLLSTHAFTDTYIDAKIYHRTITCRQHIYSYILTLLKPNLLQKSQKELTTRRKEKFAAQLAEQTQKHASEIAQMRATHAADLDHAQLGLDRCRAQHDEALAALRAGHEEAVAQLSAGFSAEVHRMNTGNEKGRILLREDIQFQVNAVATCLSLIVFSKSNKLFSGYFDPVYIFFY